MAQMQSAPSLPAGNPSAREYFNYSMATLSNAAMPQAMMPQGISSLVPQYQSGGDVGVDLGFDPGLALGFDSGSDSGSDPGVNAPDVSGPDPFSPDAAMAEAAIAAQAAQAAQQAEQSNQDVMALTQPSGGSTPVGMQESQQAQDGAGTSTGPMTVQDYKDYYDSRASAATDPEYAESRQDLYNFLVNDYKGNVVTGKDETAKAEDLNKGLVNSLIKTFTPFQKGPVYNPATGSMTVGTYVDRGGLVGGGLGALVGGPFGALVGGFLGSGRGGYVPVNSIMSGSDDFGNPDMDMVNTPSESEIDNIIDQMTPPDTGDNIDPDLGDPQQAAAAVAPAYVPPVYQTYAGLGLPSVSPIPPLRRVTVPISSFVV